MSRILTGLKLIGCLFGGAISASILLSIVFLCVFGLHDPDRIWRFIEVTRPITVVLGAGAGAIIFFRSACEARPAPDQGPEGVDEGKPVGSRANGAPTGPTA